MKSNRVCLGLSFVLASLTSFGAFAPLARACSNAVDEEIDPTVMLLKEADQKLDDGDPDGAFAAAIEAFPSVMTSAAVEEKSSDEIRKNRAIRIVSLAIIRTADDVDGWPASEENITRARHRLEELAKLRDGPLTRTDLAEAHETTDSAEAKSALEALAARDVVATPYGYGTLARLRAAAGDAPGSAAALEACERMAATPTICAAPPKLNTSFAHATGRFVRGRWTLILVLASIGALVAWISHRRIERLTSPRAI